MPTNKILFQSKMRNCATVAFMPTVSRSVCTPLVPFARENVRIQGCGLFVLGIFPGAFVDLPKDQVTVLAPWKQLKIYCAGIWHNLVTVAAALLLLTGNRFLMTPFYKEHAGVTVISVAEVSLTCKESDL